MQTGNTFGGMEMSQMNKSVFFIGCSTPTVEKKNTKNRSATAGIDGELLGIEKWEHVWLLTDCD